MSLREKFRHLENKISLKKANNIDYASDETEQLSLFVRDALNDATINGVAAEYEYEKSVFEKEFGSMPNNSLKTIKKPSSYIEKLINKINLLYLNANNPKLLSTYKGVLIIAITKITFKAESLAEENSCELFHTKNYIDPSKDLRIVDSLKMSLEQAYDVWYAAMQENVKYIRKSLATKDINSISEACYNFAFIDIIAASVH